MKVRIYALLIVSAMLLPSCSDPYFSMSGESQLKIEKDIHFLKMYKTTLCSIREGHEREEISPGKCLALYYDFKENDSVQDGKKEVVKRVNYILNNSVKFDKNYSVQLYKFTTEIGGCTSYIKQNCM